jgi:putative transposase
MEHHDLSLRRQCELLSLNRGRLYYEKRPASQRNLAVMEAIDRQYLVTPYYGIRKMTEVLRRQGFHVNHKRVQRLMRVMGLTAIYQKPKTSRRNRQHAVYPYLLRNLAIERPNQVWAADITYIPMAHGFVYLVAILDWHSRYVLSWRVSNSMHGGFCLEALEDAFQRHGTPEISNTDQGSQFTAQAWIDCLKAQAIRISMDGRGRFLDNIFVERLWRTVKYEDLYLKRYESVTELKTGLAAYFRHYNETRIHQALDYQTPAQVYGVEKPFIAQHPLGGKVSGSRLQLSNSFPTQPVTTTRK